MMALGVDFGSWKYGDGICGKIFQDRNSSRCFAFMIHSPENQAMFQGVSKKKIKDLFPQHNFSFVEETKMMFDMDDFLKVIVSKKAVRSYIAYRALPYFL